MPNSNAVAKNNILEDYNKAEIINPPSKIPKIFSCPEQSEQTKLNLAISYSYIAENQLANHKKGIQLFEIPPTEDNCQAYCGLEYDYKEGGCGEEWWNPDDSWVVLPNTTDVSCHKGFEKVFQYGGPNNHLARQWGDGTILHKDGCTSFGATPVLRALDSNQPYIINNYGTIEKIWIKPYPPEVPEPYLRWQSTHFHDYVGSAYDCWKSNTLSLDYLKKNGDQKWQHYYDQMKKSESSSPSVWNLHCNLFYKQQNTNALAQLGNAFVNDKSLKLRV